MIRAIHRSARFGFAFTVATTVMRLSLPMARRRFCGTPETVCGSWGSPLATTATLRGLDLLTLAEMMYAPEASRVDQPAAIALQRLGCHHSVWPAAPDFSV